MSRVVRNYLPVWLVDGRCVNHEYHFRGAAREIFSYLNLLAPKHDGFVFARVQNIVEHTKKWKREHRPFSARHCKRILAEFKQLGILGPHEVRNVKGVGLRAGWQLHPHDAYMLKEGGLCEFRSLPKTFADSGSTEDDYISEMPLQVSPHLSP